MKRITLNYLKLGTLFLFVIALFQFCIVYESNLYKLKSVTIEEAIHKDPQKAKYVKIFFKGKYSEYDRLYDVIYYKDSLLYGRFLVPEYYIASYSDEDEYSPYPDYIYEELINEDHIVKIHLLLKYN